ncbi:MAG: hypothetical protein AB8B85_10810 [Paracoccaceae bacterium]
MLGLFGIFGRASSLKALDQALREFGVNPRTVPEAAKLAAVRFMQKGPNAASKLRGANYVGAGELLGYAILGPDQFVASNSVDAANSAKLRLEAAIAAGDGLDADLILLALHSGIMHAGIADLFDIESSE